MLLWKKYICEEILYYTVATCLLLLSVLVLFDLSMNCTSYLAHNIPLIPYYIIFVSKCFTPAITFSYLIAHLIFFLITIPRYDIVALLFSKLSYKRIAQPMIMLGVVIATTCIINDYIYLTHAKTYVDKLFCNTKHTPQLTIKHLHNGSMLIYKKEDIEGMHDVFWIKSIADIWHFHTLYRGVGSHADHFALKENGYQKINTLQTMTLTSQDLCTKDLAIKATMFLGITAIIIPIAALTFLFAGRGDHNHFLRIIAAIVLFLLFMVVVKCLDITYEMQGETNVFAILILFLSPCIFFGYKFSYI